MLYAIHFEWTRGPKENILIHERLPKLGAVFNAGAAALAPSWALHPPTPGPPPLPKPPKSPPGTSPLDAGGWMQGVYRWIPPGWLRAWGTVGGKIAPEAPRGVLGEI